MSASAGAKRDIKIDLIRQINQTLVTRGRPSLSTHDFDILYDLTIKELIEVKQELIRDLDYA